MEADGGGIYTPSATSAGSLVQYNIVDNVIGPKLHTYLNYDHAYGIYLDEGSRGDTVRYNTVMNISDAGIFLHLPNGHNINNNTVYNNRIGILNNTPSWRWWEVPGATTTTITYNNVIVGDGIDDYFAGGKDMLFDKRYTDKITVNNNKYINTRSSQDIFKNVGTVYNFTDWKTNSTHDANSSLNNTAMGANETQRLIFNPRTTTQRFYMNNATSVKDSANALMTADFDLRPFTSKYVRGLNVDCILPYSDAVAPTVTAFTVPETTSGLTVTVSTFTASADATAYIITESATAPELTNSAWSATAPSTFTLSATGTKTMYAWVRDVAGNISASASDVTESDYNTATLSRELIAVYDFEETTGLAQDGSGNALHASSHQTGVTINQTGNPGKSYSFTGTTFSTNNVVVNDNNLLTFTDSMTVVVWLKLTTINKGQAIVYKGDSNNYEYLLTIGTNNKVSFYIYQNGTATTMIVTGSTALAANTDYIIEFSTSNVLARSAMKIRINGVEETLTGTNNTTSTNMLNGTAPLRFGGDTQIGRYLTGNLSQVAMWSRLLTSDERAALYGGGAGLSESEW
jgi:hypothetical protein